jgi:hypothetical protein
MALQGKKNRMPPQKKHWHRGSLSEIAMAVTLGAGLDLVPITCAVAKKVYIPPPAVVVQREPVPAGNRDRETSRY